MAEGAGFPTVGMGKGFKRDGGKKRILKLLNLEDSSFKSILRLRD